MNKDVAIMWADALRSGGYPQTTGCLLDIADDGLRSYCCLGVLCDLHRRRTNQGDWSFGTYRTEDGFSGDIPTADVVRWAGLREPNPTVRDGDALDGNTIAELNDNQGWTFGKLADLIEERWEKM